MKNTEEHMSVFSMSIFLRIAEVVYLRAIITVQDGSLLFSIASNILIYSTRVAHSNLEDFYCYRKN